MLLKGISAVTIGQSHINNGTVCQDFAELDIQNKDYVMAAVADGHGSKKHFRSDKGSEFAAKSAKESIYEYMHDYEKFAEAYSIDRDYLIDRIIKMVITKWHDKIREDLDENPITQEEIDKYLGGTFNKDKVSSIYGTTLLVGVMSEKCSFGFLIGDGSFVVINKHGKAYIPIEDTNSKANYTSSLSSSDSYNGFVKYFFDEMPFSIMVSTDGLVKSFANDSDFLDYNQAIAMELGGLDTTDKIDQMEARLIKLFEQRSRDGSEDDISISIIFNIDAYSSVIEGLQTRRKINKLDEQIELSKKKITTLNFKLQQSESVRRENRKKLKEMDDERKAIVEYKKKLDLRKLELENELRKIEQQQEAADKKKIMIDSEYEKYYEIEKDKEQEINENLQSQEEEKQKMQNNEMEIDKLKNELSI